MISKTSQNTLACAILVAIFSSVLADAAIVQIGVQADTYIRNDGGGPNSKNDGDGDNEIIVGINGSPAAELNGLLRFDLSPLAGMGSTINSVTLTGTTRGGANGAGSNNNFTVYDYGFEFIEADATYNDPDGDGAAGTGDTTAGGTLGTIVTTGLVASNVSGQTIVFGDSPAFRNAVATQLAGDQTLNLLLRGAPAAGNQGFLRFDDEDRPNPFLLTVDIVPEPGTASLLGLSALALIARRRRP